MLTPKKNSVSEILFIDPYSGFFPKNTAGLAYIRGFLHAKGYQTETLNFNTIFDQGVKAGYQNALVSFLRDNKLFDSNFNKVSNKNFLYFLLVRIYYLGPEFIWQAVDQIDIFDDIIKKHLQPYKKINRIGISITYSQQLLFALIFIDRIKKLNKNVELILGGSLVSSCVDDFIELFSNRPSVDRFVTGEGETVLSELIKGIDLAAVPNSYYLQNGKYKKSPKIIQENFSLLPAPIYIPGEKFFFQHSRQCYWGRCKFCIADGYRHGIRSSVKSAKTIVDEIAYNNKANGTNDSYCQFIDNALSKGFIVDFANCIKLCPEIRNSYSGYMRCEPWVDENIIRVAKQAGFIGLSFGVETLNPRLQKLIDKGIKNDDVYRIFEICKKTDMRLIVFFMVGLPTQTKKELLEDLNLITKLLRQYPNINMLQITPFSLKKDTPIYNDPESYHIELAKNTKVFLANHYGFKQLDQGAVSFQEAVNLTLFFARENWADYSDIVDIWL